jgi:hypothetical protein
MADNIINDLLKEKRGWRITPPIEKLLEKIIGLEEQIARYDAGKLNDGQKHILKTCEDYIKIAKELLKAKGSSHPHLVWNLLHRVDEHVILLMEEHELSARVIDVKAAFDLTIKEEAVRKEWLGDKGKLTEAFNDIIGGGKNIDKSRYMVKEALQYLDDFVDYGFWKLSMNILMSVWSAALLALTMLVYFSVYYPQRSIGATGTDLMPFAILGLMGGYLSNLLTKEDFLFVWGGPFFRYLAYNLMARPVVGAFSAMFFILVEKSKLLFSINPSGSSVPQSVQSSVINISVNANVIEYVYIVFAIAVGFAGEKALRGMMDKVLKQLEEKAEKTKETSPGAKKDEKKH